MSEREMSNSNGFTLTGNSIGVLMIHGFGGSPISVTPWAHSLHNEGFTVMVPQLPGHGTTWVDLNRTTYHDWYQCVDSALTELKKSCSRIFVAGFSMGGALALRLSQIRGSEIDGLLLVNPVVHDRRAMMKLVPALRFVLPSLKGGPTDVAAPNPPVHSYRRIALRALHSARQLWRVVERDLYLVENPMMIGYSPHDHVVDPSNSETIIDNVSSIDIREVIFEKSFHNVALDYDAPLLNIESHAFIKDVLTGEISSPNSFQTDDELELVRAEFDEIVSQLDVPGSDYLSIVENSQSVEAKLERELYAQPQPLPRLSRRQRNALIAIVGGPIYIVAIRLFNFDPLGLNGWPGLLAMMVGAVVLFQGMKNDPVDGDGSAL